MTRSPRRFRFGEFRFDLDTGELAGRAGTTRLQPKPAALLSLLLTRAGTLVTREELQQELWPETRVEFDQGLNYCMRQIRVALGEEAEGGCIETLPRRGYRLRVPVEPIVERRGRPWMPGLAVALVLIGVGLGLAAWRAGAFAPSAAAIRVAVLPLEDRGGDGASVRVNDLLTESLVVRLTAEGRRLAVLGPATTGRYRGSDAEHMEIGRELDVDFVVSGGYRAAEGRFFVQMVRRRDGEHVFARRIDSGAEPGDRALQAIVEGIVAKLDAGG